MTAHDVALSRANAHQVAKAAQREAEMLAYVPHDPWAADCPDPLAGTVDPKAAGWNNDPSQWRLHYRVQPVQMGELDRLCTEQAAFLATCTPERAAELTEMWS